MPDPSRGANPIAVFYQAAAARLIGRRALLLAIFALLGWLVLFAHLAPSFGFAGAGFVLVVGLLIPNRPGQSGPEALSDGQQSPALLEAIGNMADALSDPCLVLDRRSIIVHANPPAAAEFPMARSGSPLTLSLRHPTLIGAVDAARRLGTPQLIELHQTIPNQTWHRVAVAPLKPVQNIPSGLLIVTLQSLTDQKQIDAMRSDFIANASHELRTPLTSLVGFIDTLLGPAAKDEAARERFLLIMRTQAGRMSKLIDDLLSLNRIEMRQHVRPTGSVDLAKLLAEVRDGLQTQAEAAGVTVQMQLDLPEAIVTGEHDELYEVFENLIDNALKYGGDGGAVEIALSAASRPGYEFLVSVVDHGAGIEPVHVPRLTERFYRVDAESSRKKKGTGLGLAIVKHILNRHRGAMSIKSAPGEGTRVDVLLPK